MASIQLRSDPISDAELFKLACEFDLGPEPICNGKYRWWEMFPQERRENHVYIRCTGNPDPDGPPRYGIFRDGRSCCLNKYGEWEYQSLPSSRTDDFYERCRFASIHEAVNFYRDWHKAICEWAESRWAEKNAVTLEEGRKVILNYEECPVVGS